MDQDCKLKGIINSLRHKSILVTGSTGFLAKIFIEKVLRVQPNVKKLFLLLRANNAASASQRLHNEVLGKEVFRVLKESHGASFNAFVSEKVTPIAGDVSYENMGVTDKDLVEKMWNEVEMVVNFAATTDFRDRYDVSLAINTIGAKNVINFAKKCEKLEMILHVSTAYVCGEKSGLILEAPLKMGEALNGATGLEFEEEMKLVERNLNILKAQKVGKEQETEAMKELGLKRARLFGWPNTYVFTKALGEMVIGELRGDLPLVIARPTVISGTYKEPFPGWVEGFRTMDSVFIGYGKGKFSCFLGDPKSILDVMPGDMVSNAIIVAMVKHASQPNEFIYQIGSSARNPMEMSKVCDTSYSYFTKKPLIGKNGKPIKVSKKSVLLPTTSGFRRYVHLHYMLPLRGLQLVNIAFCQHFQQLCSNSKRKINLLLRLVELYRPYVLFKGVFDDANLEKLRVTVRASATEGDVFYFDPSCIDWDDYIVDTHIRGLVQYVVES